MASVGTDMVCVFVGIVRSQLVLRSGLVIEYFESVSLIHTVSSGTSPCTAFHSSIPSYIKRDRLSYSVSCLDATLYDPF